MAGDLDALATALQNLVNVLQLLQAAQSPLAQPAPAAPQPAALQPCFDDSRTPFDRGSHARCNDAANDRTLSILEVTNTNKCQDESLTMTSNSNSKNERSEVAGKVDAQNKDTKKRAFDDIAPLNRNEEESQFDDAANDSKLQKNDMAQRAQRFGKALVRKEPRTGEPPTIENTDSMDLSLLSIPVQGVPGEQENSTATTNPRSTERESVKEKHCALQSMEEKLTPHQVHFAKTQYDNFRRDIEDTLDRENLDTPNSLGPRLTIGHGFNSNHAFRYWYKAFDSRSGSELDPKTFGFLFAPTPITRCKEIKIRYAELRSQIGKSWKFSMRQDITLLKQIGDAMELPVAQLKTKDKGGPTRYFFSRLWNQLGNLSIQLPILGGKDIHIELFESCQGGLLPITDEMLEIHLKKMDQSDRETVEAQIQAYFRAIGRILAHCMLKSIVVASHVLPDLYKTVLLRGLDIEKEEYPLGVLINHAGALLDFDYSKMDEPSKMLLQRKLGLDDSDANDSLPLRKQIKEIFVDNRRLSLEYLREGLTLGGTINWRTLFGWVPTPTVNKLVFGRQGISEDMVLTSDGKLRFIRFEQDYFEKDKSIIYKEVQKQFETRFTEFVRQKMKDDPTFMANFVEFCTGSPFLPDIDLNPDFHIQMEYNWSEMGQDFLPVVHTSDNCIIIPAQAYEADIEVFQDKLATVMRLCQTNFDTR